MQQIEHIMSRIGHWLVLALTAVAYVSQKVQALTPEVNNTIQMAMLVLGATTVAAIVHSAIVQKALAAASAVAQGASSVQQAAGAVAGAIQSAQQQVPPKS